MVKIKTLLRLITYLCIAAGYASVAPYVAVYYSLSFGVLSAVAITLDHIGRIRLPRWLLNLIAVAVLVYSFSRITPDYLIEPILNACLILIAIKLLEEKKFRDYMQIYALCMFLLIGSSLISFSVIFLLYFCLLFALSTASLMLLAYFSQEEEMVITRNNMVKILQHAVMICVISIPASGLFFLILPRTNYPLFTFLNHWAYAKSGFSDKVALGDVAGIQEDNHVIFRAEMPKVDDSLLYWRGVELDTFDGTAWTASSGRPTPLGAVAGGTILQTIYLEPYGNKYLFALDKPVSIEVYSGRRQRRLSVNHWFRQVEERLKYTALSVPTNLIPDKTIDLNRYLQLPADFSPRIRGLVEDILRDRPGDPAMALFDHVKYGEYKYSLDNLPFSKTPLEVFLFSRKAGNCEYFAASLAVMLRMAGIPARLIGGYRSGYYNPTAGYYMVLQKNAHVWVEAYMDERGWLRLDPTPYTIETPSEAYGRSLLLKLSLMMDTFNYYWDKTIISYDFNQQVKILRQINTLFEHPSFSLKANKDTITKYLTGIVVILLLAGLIYGLLRHQKSEEAKIIDKFARKMAALGYRKRETEGLEEFLDRVAEGDVRRRAHLFVEEFQQLFYKDCMFDRERIVHLEKKIDDI
jgi:protein-glutamine gamma-glutamyltransferase